ncbi:ARM repeat-containing protein [Hysterangium stoloniferum]|nr:ARM repeat-containing protein [Hysterangium stoloniferum]
MDEEVNQIIQAIYIAANPTTSDRLVYQQALDFLTEVLSKSADTWKIGLALFVESDASGARKHPPQVRLWSLRLVENFLDERVDPLDDESFQTLQQTLFNYIQTEYVYGPAEANQTFIRNKFSYVLSLFFVCTYPGQNPSFFSDLFTLIRPQSSSNSFNPHVSLLLFHLIIEISGEVADQLLKSARAYSGPRHARDTRVRDAVRERDAPIINEAVLTIINESNERMKALRNREVQPVIEREEEIKEEIVDWGIRAFGSYIHWIDINLTVTPQTIQLLFALLADPSLAIRLATSNALLKMLQKGLKSPADKLQLLKVLSLGEVLAALEERTRTEKTERKAQNRTDEGEESYRESLGRLLSALGQELIKLWEDDKNDEDVSMGSGELLEQVLPLMLRFMADEYDDTSSTVFPLLTSLLTAYKRLKKSNPDGFMSSEKLTFLQQVLDTTLSKMKWDEDADPDDMDEDDLTAFDLLRKDLRVFLDSIQTLDNDLVTRTVHSVAISTLTAFNSSVNLTWQDAELAIHLVYLYGEIAKGQKGRAAFVVLPGSIVKEKRKTTDYSNYPLTPHGEMMFALVSSGISTFPHITVVMQFFETVARYADFFKVRKECVIPAIEALVDGRGVHHQKSNIRARASYLFHKFIKEDRNDVPVEIVERLLDSIRDALVIQTDLPEPESPEQDILFDAVNEPSFFDSQLYLFEAAGTLVSVMFTVPEQQAALLRSVMKPVTDEMEKALQTPMQGPLDVLPVLQVHHCVMALGAIAKGFVDFPNPVPPDYILPPLEVFEQAAQAILVSLDVMNRFKIVREATRSAFSRLLASTGPTMTKYIPALMGSLLVHFDSGELVEFVRFIGHLIHKLQDQILDVLDQLITPLSTHIFSVLAAPSETSSERQLHLETKKEYLNLLNNIISSKQHVVLTSARNKGGFETILTMAVQIAQDFSDNNGQKLAFSLLSRTITVWGQPGPPSNESLNGNGTSTQIPGFERFLYEQLVPVAFKVPSSPQFNVKDGQMMVLCHEIGGMLQLICKTRGQEAYDYLVNVFLPSQNCPPEMATDFATKIRDYDSKTFKKFFTDFVRASRS